MAYLSGSSGAYTLKSGSLSVSGDEVIGSYGIGNLNQTGGSNTVAGNLTLGDQHQGSGAYNLKFGSLSVSGEEIIGNHGTGVVNQNGGQHTVADTLILARNPGSSGTYNLNRGTLKANDEIIGPLGTGVFNQNGGANIITNSLTLSPPGGTGTYNLNGGTLSAKTIDIHPNDAFNVMNTITTVTGDVTNYGTVKTTKAAVTWNGTFTNNGAYISDPASQTFTDLKVVDPGFLLAASQDVFKIKNDFDNQSANASAWDTMAATLQFITGADKSHYFSIAGADHGSSYNYSNTEFSWGTLNILGQTVRLLDGNTTNIGTAQYVKVLLGADVNYATRFVNNIFDDAGSPINIYYDPKALANLYLFGLDYTFAGGGKLIADASVPLPPSVFLLGSGLLGLGLLGWRRKRLTS